MSTPLREGESADYRPRKRDFDQLDRDDGMHLKEIHTPAGSIIKRADVNMMKLEDSLTRSPLNEIAVLVKALTYGEMVDLAVAIWKVRPGDGVITESVIPEMLHRWCVRHLDPPPSNEIITNAETSQERPPAMERGQASGNGKENSQGGSQGSP